MEQFTQELPVRGSEMLKSFLH